MMHVRLVGGVQFLYCSSTSTTSGRLAVVCDKSPAKNGNWNLTEPGDRRHRPGVH